MKGIPFLRSCMRSTPALIKIQRNSDRVILWQVRFLSSDPIPQPPFELDLEAQSRFGGYTVTLEWSE